MNESNINKKRWVELNLLIDIEHDEIYVQGGDREPCSHGYPPCCDTKYIGYEWLKEKMKQGQ